MTVVLAAQVYKAGVLAAHLTRKADRVEFRYDSQYLQSRGVAVATTLPLADEVTFTPPGSVPPFFAGLLPEGRRLSALRRTVKTSLSRKHERYILKLNPPENPHFVENEAFFIGLAKECRLSAVAARLIHDADGEPGLLVTRFDRATHEKQSCSIAAEDACQLLGKWPADK